jgi:hypothetical protein
LLRSVVASPLPHPGPEPVLDVFWSTSTRRWLTALLVVAAIAVFALKASREMRDFEVYWTAGVRAARAEPLYRPDDGHFVFKYLPAFAVLAIPAGLLPLPAAKASWFVVSALLIVTLFARSVQILPRRLKPAWALGIILLVVLGKFLGHELILGQVNILMATAAASALLAMKSHREARAGALIALAIVVKPYAVLLLPWLIARRRAGSILAAAGGLLLVLIAPAALYGWSGNLAQHRAWWEIVNATTAPNLIVADNVSLSSASARLFGLGDPAARWAALGASIFLLMVAGWVFLLRRRVEFPDGLEGALLLTLMPLLSPQGWDYVFLLSAPAVAYLGNYEGRLPAAWRGATIVALAAIGLSLFDVMGRSAYRAFMEASMITWLYLVVIAALTALRARKIA